MRTIKFRMWDFGNKTMIDGDSLAFEEYAPVTHLLSQKGIMQYTGLKDKNGKEIYEGDIVKWKPWEGFEEITPIEWDQAMCRYVCRTNEGTWRMFGSDLTFEVIGNIYSNPELVIA